MPLKRKKQKIYMLFLKKYGIIFIKCTESRLINEKITDY